MENFEIFLNKAYRFLSYRPRSEKEVIDYLKKKSSFAKASEGQEKQILESVIASVMIKLKEQKFINDKEFANWWIEQRTKFRPKALRIIKLELKQKGIDKDLIEEILLSGSSQTESEFDKALKLAQKRITRYKNDDPKKAYEKMVRFLSSKGFDWDTIKNVIDRILPKRYNTN